MRNKRVSHALLKQRQMCFQQCGNKVNIFHDAYDCQSIHNFVCIKKQIGLFFVEPSINSNMTIDGSIDDEYPICAGPNFSIYLSFLVTDYKKLTQFLLYPVSGMIHS